MARNDDNQGKKPSVEGRHGDKTHSAFLENLHSNSRDDDADDAGGKHLGDAASPAPDGRHRLHEDRQQHDEAEKDSEYNRLSR
jgi:hypothetical protein